ncbi:hypothetical protein [Planococcus lenghuensis]|nr:hypothetical protein [Planococcus lenghuensis]
MEDNKVDSKKKRLNIVSAIIYIPMFLGMIQFFFDENYRNDGLGWLLLLTFWVIRNIDQAIRDWWDKKQKSVLFDLLLAAVVLVFLIIRGMEYFSS